jgi:hypothetical protein
MPATKQYRPKDHTNHIPSIANMYNIVTNKAHGTNKAPANTDSHWTFALIAFISAGMLDPYSVLIALATSAIIYNIMAIRTSFLFFIVTTF